MWKPIFVEVEKAVCFALTILLLLNVSLVSVPVKATPTILEVINPLDGTHYFNLTTDTSQVGDRFVVNITVADVMELHSWQIRFTWNASLLDFVNIMLPSDHVFYVPGESASTSVVEPGNVLWSVASNDQYWTFNGTGCLCQVMLRMRLSADEMSSLKYNCSLALVDLETNTFLMDRLGSHIPFVSSDGLYNIMYVSPSYYPVICIKPSNEKPSNLGDIFALEVWVKNVSFGWSIIGFQFSLMWNVTFIEPALGLSGNYYEPGVFLEAYQYSPNGTSYAAEINMHERLPPLTPIPEGYNFSKFTCMLLMDNLPNPPYHAPFSTVGSCGAKLMTVYFKAVYETISPVEDWTWIEFIDFKIDEDTYALDQYLYVVPLNIEDCHYRAPMKVLGLAIDLYTQYPFPYGGQGKHMPSDMFGPQQEVDLFALVAYSEYPIQQVPVGFRIICDGYDNYTECTTDEDGIAHLTFRLPWPCVDPETEIFGKWLVIATVEADEQVENDTLAFWVWWKIEVLGVEPRKTEFVQRKMGGDDLLFTVIYGTYSMQLLDVTLTVTVYDELGFFIGSAYIHTAVGWGEYKYYDYLACEEPPFKTYGPCNITIPMPTNAVVGKGQVFANAFTNFPWNGGAPYCPEVKNTIDFYITKPP